MTMGIDGAGNATRDDDTSGTVTGNDMGAERAAHAQASTNDTRSQPRAETQTREQYADAMRANGSPMSRDNSPDNREAPESEPRDQQGPQAGHAVDRDRAEPRDRETYADDIRAGHNADEHQGPTTATAADLPAGTTLDPSPEPNGHRADQQSDDHMAAFQQAADVPTLTDTDSTGTSDGPDANELADSSNHPADDQPGSHIFDADQTAAPVQGQRGADHRPETITFDNKDIEVTHNAADGIWIEGLPGEPPTRIGDVISSPEESGRSRSENLREELTRDADDLVDMGGKWTDLLRDTLGTPPPTNSMTHSRAPEITASRPEHGIDAGHGAEAFLTLAIVGAAAIHKLHERWQQAWHH
jgi:hypothetical protein